MKIRIKTSALLLSLLVVFIFVAASIVFAASFHDEAEEFLNSQCSRSRRGLIAVLCSFNDRLDNLETASHDPHPAGKHILDIGQVRGAGLDIDAPTSPIKTPGEVTVNCSEACTLWVNYDVDTRNTTISGAPPNGFNHLYHIFIDDVDQAVFNQVSASVPNAAYPLAVNGVFPVSAGVHTVSIYVKVTGGHLQQFTSHLQVLAIE